MARTKQQNELADRDRRSREILKRLARGNDVTFTQLLDGIEDGNVILDVLVNPEYEHPEWASESPEVE